MYSAHFTIAITKHRANVIRLTTEFLYIVRNLCIPRITKEVEAQILDLVRYLSSYYRSNRLGLSHWDPYAVCRGSCVIVTWWSGSGGIHA